MQSYRLKLKILFIVYVLVFISLFLYSFTQIDLGLVISRYHFLYQIEKTFQYIGYFNRPLSTLFYLLILVCLTALYLYLLWYSSKKKLEKRFIWKIIFIGCILLTFSYNAFSYDLFNYIFDAKIVTHYHSNPYIHKALDYQADPMLAFMHWTHRVYPYGPFWLVLTVPLSFIGFQLFLPTFFLFKLLMTASYVGSLYYVGKIFQKFFPEKETYALIFWGLNPLILIESLVSSHIDIVMIFFILVAFWFALQQKYVVSYLTFLFSAGIKFLTGLLFPVFVYINLMNKQKKKLALEKIMGLSLLLLTVGVVIETKESGNFQPWYLIAPLSFAVFLSHKYYIIMPSVIISVLSLLLYVPYLYLGNWNPPVPQILNQIMYVSYGLSLVTVLGFYFYKKRKLTKTKNNV